MMNSINSNKSNRLAGTYKTMTQSEGKKLQGTNYAFSNHIILVNVSSRSQSIINDIVKSIPRGFTSNDKIVHSKSLNPNKNSIVSFQEKLFHVAEMILNEENLSNKEFQGVLSALKKEYSSVDRYIDSKEMKGYKSFQDN